MKTAPFSEGQTGWIYNGLLRAFAANQNPPKELRLFVIQFMRHYVFHYVNHILNWRVDVLAGTHSSGFVTELVPQ